MKQLRQPTSRIILLVALTFLLVPAIDAQVKNQVSLEASVAEYLKTSGYKYKKLGTDAWAVELNNEQILVAAQKDFFLAGVVIAKKDEFRATIESLTELLKAAHNLDFIKVGIDDEGDVFVRLEQKGKTIGKQEFYSMIEVVASSAQQARSRIQPYLNKK